MGLFGCKHKFSATVDEKGLQYCEKCGKAFTAPCPHRWELLDSKRQQCTRCGLIEPIKTEPCSHIWEICSIRDIRNKYSGNTIDTIYVQRCKKCGVMRDYVCGISSRYRR